MKKWREMAADLFGADIKDTLKYSLVAGALAHGVALFNKLSWHDDLNYGLKLSQNQVIRLGRWLRGALGALVAALFNGKNISLPLVYGLASLLLIALSSHVVIRLMDIRRKPLRMAVCALMAAFPVVTSTLSYMFTAPYYFLALLLSVLAVYIAAERPRWDGFLAAMLCVACGLGLYQAYFPVAVSLFVIRLIYEIADGRHATLGKAILRGVYFLAVCACGMILYFAIWKATMAAMGLSASTYQGFSDIGSAKFKAYKRAVKMAYRRFILIFGKKKTENVYPMSLGWAQWALEGLSLLCALALAVRCFRRKKRLQAAMLAVLAAGLPVCFNLIYVMSASASDTNVHTLMLYAQCMLYVFLAAALELLLRDGGKAVKALYRVAIVALLLMVCLDVTFDNACYVKAEMMMSQTLSDLTTLVTRIKSVEGYTDELPICLSKTGHKDATLAKNTVFEDIKIYPFNKLYPYHYRWDMYSYLRYWVGFQPVYVDYTKFGHEEEIEAMPDYPDDGSIKIIDGTVVVKW